MNEILVDFEFVMGTYRWLGCPSLSRIITQGFSKNGSNPPSPNDWGPNPCLGPICLCFVHPVPSALALISFLAFGPAKGIPALSGSSCFRAFTYTQPLVWKWPLSSPQSAHSEAWGSLSRMHIRNAALQTVTHSLQYPGLTRGQSQV